MTGFGDRASKEVITVKWGQKGEALIQDDWHPSKKKKMFAEIKITFTNTQP